MKSGSMQPVEKYGEPCRIRTCDPLIKSYTTDNALLFHILANAYIYLHLKDTREGKAFLFLPMFAGMNCTKTAQRKDSNSMPSNWQSRKFRKSFVKFDYTSNWLYIINK
jgi:hypothetical protein